MTCDHEENGRLVVTITAAFSVLHAATRAKLVRCGCPVAACLLMFSRGKGQADP